MTYTGEYRSLEQELAEIDAVTLDDLKRLCEEYPWHPRVVGEIRPG